MSNQLSNEYLNSLQKITYAQLIEMQAEFQNDYPNQKNPFFRPQETAQVFAKHGLTPALFLDFERDTVLVTSEERLRNRLH